jgi:hypothetical protein
LGLGLDLGFGAGGAGGEGFWGMIIGICLIGFLLGSLDESLLSFLTTAFFTLTLAFDFFGDLTFFFFFLS